MTDRAEQIRAEAATWVVRTGDPGFDAWNTFTEWLEADPAHSEAYQALAEDVESLDPELAELARGPIQQPDVSRPARRVLPWAVAACVAGLSALGLSIGPAIRGTTYETAPGEMRTVTLAAGDTLVLNGGTAITVRQFAGRRVTLDHGQLLLRLEGRGSPVRVMSGDLELVDVGTVFEVTRAAFATRVVVAQGAVLADPGSARLRIDAGQRLEAADGAAMLKAEAATGPVASWTEGQLDYVAEPLEQVAADLARSTGVDFFVDPAMRRQPFSGTLSVAGVRRDPSSLGPLLGASVKRSGDQWIIGKG